MAFQVTTVKYSGKINEVTLGAGKTVTVGGATAYPFFTFEGKMPNKPKIAMEIWDMDPGDAWPAAVKAPFEGVLGDPGAWAKKCVEFGADMVLVQLKSTDPNADNKGAAEAVAAVKAVLGAVDVPVAVYGVANKEKDVETLSAVAETFQGKNLLLGPVEEQTHKQLGAQALAYKHTVAANTPIDVNLAKQLNILLGNLGLTNEKLIIDPTTGGLGYGMEYCYSVMERIRMAGLVQQDDNLQQPIINNMAQEVWKCKEAGLSLDDAPTLGHQDDRGVLMEATEAISLLLAGSDMVVLRHPETVKLVKKWIDLAYEGGQAAAEGIKAVQAVDAAKLPKVAFTPSGPPKKEVKAAAPAKKAPPKAEAKPAEKPAAKPALAAVPKKEAAPAKVEEPKAAPVVDEGKVKAEAEAKAKVEAEAKVKAEADAKAKAAADAKKKAEEEEAKKKAEAEAKAKAKAKEEDELAALRAQRAKEREEMEAKRAAEAEGPRELKKADKVVPAQYKVAAGIVSSLERIHRRQRKEWDWTPPKES